MYRCATALRLAGWVKNSPQGVVVEAEGKPGDVAELVTTIRQRPPPSASIAGIECRTLAVCGDTGFSVHASERHGLRVAHVLPDLAPCDACLRELFDTANRRHLYPFINCTHCGPRYSIVEDIPYDRARTSMRHFRMCAACRAEYADPRDRRFHAEPNACARCGPRLALWDPQGKSLHDGHPAMLAAVDAVRAGRIVAIKGVGGFQLIADARDEAAVQHLRERKQRGEKPFAVMFPSLHETSRHCRVSPEEAELLSGRARPIVLLKRTGGSIACAAAPGNALLGAMLPSSPLHEILLRELGFPIIATSGNVAGEPIVTDETEALRRLAGIAELFLVHNRRITRPVDDSVARVVCGRALLLRRARGYAPAAVAVDGLASGIVAVGGHLKATVAVTVDGAVILSPHIGDLETIASRDAHARAQADLVRIYGVTPRLVAHDLHPDYATTRAAAASACATRAVPHHLAHVVAVAAEQRVELPALGVAWDGSGYGVDGTLWGGEFLLVERNRWQRVAHLRAFRLPGGSAAMREPRRAALGVLFEAFGARAFDMPALAPLAAFTTSELRVLRTMLERGVNAPFTTSAGRLFDAFAALTGVRQCASYEGQAAAELETVAADCARKYPFELRGGRAGLVIDWQPALEAAIADLAVSADASVISARLHNGLAAVIAAVAARLNAERVILCGGCFQNARLTEASVAALNAANRAAFCAQRIPPNDGGLALGQAVWADWTERHGESRCV